MALVRVHVHQAAATIILDRPEKRNALTRELLHELRQALDDVRQQLSVRAVILTGAGSAFCAGMDLGQMRQTSAEPNAQQLWQGDAELYHDLLLDMLRFPKPIIAAVNGPAVAGGGGLVLGCDVVVAAETASFGLPEPRRGIVAGLVTPMLVFRIGAGQAARLLLTTETIAAAEAYRIGLFHEVVADDQLWPRAQALAEQCALSAPEALLLTKRMLNDNVGEQLTTLLAVGAAVSATARTTEAAAEGLAAFLEKRSPNWTGNKP